MEIFDVIDKDGNPTGETVTRETGTCRGHPTPDSTYMDSFAKKKDAYRSVAYRNVSKNKDSFPGMFDTSSAGHIQAGDEPLESALRELEEELGIHATPEQLALCWNLPDLLRERIPRKNVPR